MARKLLRTMGSPEAIFNASLLNRNPTASGSRRAGNPHPPADERRRGTGPGPVRRNPPAHLGASRSTPERLREIYDPPPLRYVLGNT